MEQLLCAALEVCAVVIVLTKHLESHRDAVQRGWAGTQDPPVVLRGCAHHPSCTPGSPSDISPSAKVFSWKLVPCPGLGGALCHNKIPMAAVMLCPC